MAAMKRKDKLDAIGTVMLSVMTLVMALNQVVIKLTNGGFQPVFGAGLRSLGALLVLLIWIKLRRIHLPIPSRRVALSGLITGGLFTAEFICLFWALDLTTVARATIIFYTMPVFLTLAVHFLLPSERLTAAKILGLTLALGGVIWVLFDRSSGTGSLLGDLAALAGAILWGSILLMVRLSPLSGEKAEVQLLWQLAVSAGMLLVVSPLFGPLLRQPELVHYLGLLYQILAVASFGFLAWFALVKIYPATSVASFGFLTPICSVAFGWIILKEQVGFEVIGGLTLVVIGLILVNRKPKAG